MLPGDPGSGLRAFGQGSGPRGGARLQGLVRTPTVLRTLGGAGSMESWPRAVDPGWTGPAERGGRPDERACGGPFEAAPEGRGYDS